MLPEAFSSVEPSLWMNEPLLLKAPKGTVLGKKAGKTFISVEEGSLSRTPVTGGGCVLQTLTASDIVHGFSLRVQLHNIAFWGH